MKGWIVSLACAALMAGCVHTAAPPRGMSTAGISPASTQASAVVQGEEEARTLNLRYEDVREACDDGKAAYFCSGVVYRALVWSSQYYFWNNKQETAYTGVSFSFLRRDMGTRASFNRFGYILAPANQWGQGGMHALEMYCSFAFDGYTDGYRGIHGCGARRGTPGSEPCVDQGIVTVKAFATHYLVGSNTYQRAVHQCSFGVDAPSFQLSIDARKGGLLEEDEGWRYSEQVISNWPQDIPNQLPIEALYVLPGVDVEPARAMQSDFLSQTGRLLPILRLSTSLGQPPFSFHAEDQGPPHDARYLRRAGMKPSGAGAPVTLH